MKLSAHEQAMLDGAHGPARRKAMELLVRYGEALGAERLVETKNVCGTVGASTPFLRDYGLQHGFDAVFSEFSLDAGETVTIPQVAVPSSHLQQGLDPEHAELQGIPPEVVRVYRQGEAYTARLGVQPLNTCAPYTVGNVPRRGEHCAWMESSAVVYINAVLGAKTNAEGRESAGAAMLTGRIPYWGYHLDENRGGTHLVELDIEVRSTADWGLLGYYIGERVQDRVPVVAGVREAPDLERLKHFGAAIASSGGVEMYHLAGITPEAPTVEAAFRENPISERIRYGRAERRQAYEQVNATARDRQVDFVMLGCPHYTLEQIAEACRLLEGRRVHGNTSLWIFTPRATRELADRRGYTRIIRDAGGHLMSDTCSALGRVMPKGTRVAAVDSAKQAHYLPAIMGVQCWFGSTEDCVNAAVSGKWNSELL
ncbi:MAG TPA: aconitase X catalytic domain-containing protein [Burkholderiales bacterium]|nr:aconitase X catalytic domain-containing protein [Burkholderiales bacterium]